ncbi:MAG: outer membrane beta-barrel protein [Gemmatimonadales bacterium]|jgi:hypothetical protein
MIGMKTNTRRVCLLAVAALACMTSRAQAQEPEPVPDRAFFGATLMSGVALGEFSQYVSLGGGLGIGGVYKLDDRRMWGLRLDASYLIYGSDTRHVAVHPLVDLDVRTLNQIASASIGPQVTLRGHGVRPYLFGTLGCSYFWTRSSIGDAGGTTHLDDFVFAGSAGGGLLIPVHRGHRPVYIDLSATYQRNGRVRYLREESIEELPDGSFVITPIESGGNLLLVRVGVSVGIGKRPEE